MDGIRLSNTRRRGVRIRNTHHSKTNDSLVIIQWSCDPPPEETTSDVLIEKRHEIDDIGRNNANRFFSFLPRKRQPLLEKTRNLNKDFTVVREGNIYPSTLWEEPNKSIWEKKKYTVNKNKNKSNLNVVSFRKALFNGNIIFIPIHGGNILDEEDEETLKEFTIPDNTYLVSFNPPNSNMLFLDEALTYEFLNIITSNDIMESMLHNSRIRGRVFEKEFIENIRIWGPGNTIINRGIQFDRDVDILFKPYNELKFDIKRGFSKASFRVEGNKTIADLYPKIIQQMKLTSKSKTGRGNRKNIQPKQLIKRFKKLKKTLSSNKKFKITLKQKPLL